MVHGARKLTARLSIFNDLSSQEWRIRSTFSFCEIIWRLLSLGIHRQSESRPNSETRLIQLSVNFRSGSRRDVQESMDCPETAGPLKSCSIMREPQLSFMRRTSLDIQPYIFSA